MHTDPGAEGWACARWLDVLILFPLANVLHLLRLQMTPEPQPESPRLHGAEGQQGYTSQRLNSQWRCCGCIGFHFIMAFIPQTAGVLLKGVRGLLLWKLRGKSKYAGSCVRMCFTSSAFHIERSPICATCQLKNQEVCLLCCMEMNWWCVGFQLKWSWSFCLTN